MQQFYFDLEYLTHSTALMTIKSAWKSKSYWYQVQIKLTILSKNICIKSCQAQTYWDTQDPSEGSEGPHTNCRVFSSFLWHMLYQKSQQKEISCSKLKFFLTFNSAKNPVMAELNLGLFLNGKEATIWNNYCFFTPNYKDCYFLWTFIIILKSSVAVK